MKFDLRFPLGLLFGFYGVVLVIFGMCSNPDLYDRSLRININLWWGIVLLIFGAGMFLLAWRGRSRKSPTDETH
jgi:multisubunit Na+/H+ antiporter MnhG subunit